MILLSEKQLAKEQIRLGKIGSSLLELSTKYLSYKSGGEKARNQLNYDYVMHIVSTHVQRIIEQLKRQNAKDNDCISIVWNQKEISFSLAKSFGMMKGSFEVDYEVKGNQRLHYIPWQDEIRIDMPYYLLKLVSKFNVNFCIFKHKENDTVMIQGGYYESTKIKLQCKASFINPSYIELGKFSKIQKTKFFNPFGTEIISKENIKKTLK
jgi:hypothetical protein